MEKKLTRVADATAKLISKYRGTNVEDLLIAYVQDFQAMENAADDVNKLRDLETATDLQLDLLGGVLNIDREGSSDVDYRTRIRVRILRYQSSGSLDILIAVYDALTAPRYVEARETFPAGIRLTAVGPGVSLSSAREIGYTLAGAKAAGVKLYQVSVAQDPPFVFNEDTDASGEGFGDLDDATLGGYLAEIKPDYMA